ncbi:unnamed protein product [Bemisia tabaci]|uniref:lysozyme n=2 Tax=Bemisia tabaci TaxID=7038 RepID=A0A9P0F983_BEMTA|nr:unnamed protein product [Bemisia tabaci]
MATMDSSPSAAVNPLLGQRWVSLSAALSPYPVVQCRSTPSSAKAPASPAREELGAWGRARRAASGPRHSACVDSVPRSLVRDFPAMLLPSLLGALASLLLLQLVGGQVPGWTEKCITCICDASSGCNETIGCLQDNNVKYCGMFLISHPYWKDAGEPVLDFDNPTRPGAFETCTLDSYCASRTVNQYVTRFFTDCNRNKRIECDDHARIHFFGAARCTAPIEDTLYYKDFRRCWDKKNFPPTLTT